jgi:hypothetical protein
MKGGGKMPAIAAAMALACAAEASAQQTTRGCACIHNKTGTTISYRYKWGGGQWHDVKLQPTYQNWICWKYDNAQKSSPDLTFQLDVDMSKGSAWTTYAIGRVQTAGAHCNAVGRGGHYDITYRPNTNNTFIQVTRRP